MYLAKIFEFKVYGGVKYAKFRSTEFNQTTGFFGAYGNSSHVTFKGTHECSQISQLVYQFEGAVQRDWDELQAAKFKEHD